MTNYFYNEIQFKRYFEIFDNVVQNIQRDDENTFRFISENYVNLNKKYHQNKNISTDLKNTK